MLETQARMIAELERIRKEDPAGVAAVFSHCDVIRAAIMHYAGIPLDFYQRIRIDPASVTTVDLDDYGPHIIALNET